MSASPPVAVPPGLAHALTLRDRTPVLLRPVVPEDRDALAAFVSRLSDDSRARRFLRALDELSPEELDYLTRVDHEDHEAIVALDHPERRIRGVARFVRLAERGHVAEAAVVVEDAWQNRGLGSALLDELARRAAARGIRSFSVLMRADNRRAADLFGGLGTVVSRGVQDGELEMEIALPPGVGADLARALATATADSLLCPWDLLAARGRLGERRQG